MSAASEKLKDWANEAAPEAPSRFVAGGEFLFDGDGDEASIWGNGEAVAWASGESLLLYSGPGVGKTTLAGLLVRGRLGLVSTVLGMPVVAGERRVLYLAMDRPRQISRALRRQFHPSERAVLDERLIVHKGPLADDLAKVPTLLADLAREHGADTIVIDSLKDAAARLAEDEGGRVYNIARQHALAEGVEVLELHHARKAGSEGRRRLALDDVYGSVWLVAGGGSVLALDGEPGEPVVEVYGLRTPRGDIGPWRVSIDRAAGTMSAESAPTVLEALRGQGAMLAKDVARVVRGRDDVTKAEVERVRRELDRLVTAGLVERVSTIDPRGRTGAVAFLAVHGGGE